MTPDYSNHPDAYRRDPHKSYLERAELVRRPWRETRPGWDHDHCEFCYARFTDAKSPHADAGDLHEGLCTLDEYHWCCDVCARDLDDQYRFQLVTEAAVPTVREIRDRYGIDERSSPGAKVGRSPLAYDGSGRPR